MTLKQASISSVPATTIPTIGRFISRDPIRRINAYPYAENNPLVYTDPSGKEAYSWNLINVNFEAGFIIFGGVNFSLSLNYVHNPETEEKWIVFTPSFGATLGISKLSVNYPSNDFGSDSFVLLANGGGSALLSGSISNYICTPDDLKGNALNTSMNLPGVSLSTQNDKQKNQTLTISAGPEGPVSISSYPVKTWTPFIYKIK